MSESSQAPSLYSSFHPSALPRRNKDHAWCMSPFPPFFLPFFSHPFPSDPRDPCRFLPPAFLTGSSVRLSPARTVFPESKPLFLSHHSSSSPYIPCVLELWLATENFLHCISDPAELSRLRFANLPSNFFFCAAYILFLPSLPSRIFFLNPLT